MMSQSQSQPPSPDSPHSIGPDNAVAGAGSTAISASTMGEAVRTAAMRRFPTLAWSLAVLVILVDQLSKVWAESALTEGPRAAIGPLVFRLVYNPGAAFSFATGHTWLLTIVATVIAGVLVVLTFRSHTRWLAVGYGLTLGGAVGNLCDRYFRAPGSMHGHVVDFLSVGTFPVFNLADSAVTVGVAILCLSIIFAPAPSSSPKAMSGTAATSEASATSETRA